MPAPTRKQQLATLEHNLTNHPPANPQIIEKFEALRQVAKDFGAQIIVSTPQCREQSLALTNLEQSLMWAVAALARNQIPPSPEGPASG